MKELCPGCKHCRDYSTCTEEGFTNCRAMVRVLELVKGMPEEKRSEFLDGLKRIVEKD